MTELIAMWRRFPVVAGALVLATLASAGPAAARGRLLGLVPRTVPAPLAAAAPVAAAPAPAAVIIGQTVLGAVGPGKVAFRVRLAAASLAGLRRAGPLTVTVRMTITAPGATPRVLSVRRRLRL